MGGERLDDGVPQAQKVARGGGWLKRIALTAFSVLAVFAFWLFYPVKPPQTALRAMLPAECMAALEVHAPQKLWEKTQKEKLGERIAKLPMWAALQSRLPGGMDAKSAEQVLKMLHTAAGQLVGMRNITAITGGGAVGQGQDVYAIVAVDNLGLLAAKAVWLFMSGTYGGVAAIEIPAMPGQAGVEKLYLTLAPGTRYLLLANRPELFSRFRVAAPAAVQTMYAPESGARQSVIELSVDLSEGGLSGLIPGLPGGGKLRGNFYWDGAEIGGEGEFLLPGVRPQTRIERPAPRMPDDFRGLALSFSQPKGELAGRLLSEAARGLTQAPDFNRPVLDFLRQAVNPHLQGTGLIGIAPPVAPGKGWGRFCLGWGVDDPDRAGPEFLAGLKRVIATVKTGKLDFMMDMFVNSLQLQPTESHEVRVVLPLLDSSDQPVFGFGRTGKDGWGMIRVGGEEMPVTLWDGAAGADLCSEVRLLWRHSPQLVHTAQELLRGGMIYNLLQALPGGADAGRQLVSAAGIALPALDSFELVDVEITEEAGAGGLRIGLHLSGRLRLTE